MALWLAKPARTRATQLPPINVPAQNLGNGYRNAKQKTVG